jgi:hypothetical protein
MFCSFNFFTYCDFCNLAECETNRARKESRQINTTLNEERVYFHLTCYTMYPRATLPTFRSDCREKLRYHKTGSVQPTNLVVSYCSEVCLVIWIMLTQINGHVCYNTYLLFCMELSPSWEANSCSVTQFPNILSNPEVITPFSRARHCPYPEPS